MNGPQLTKIIWSDLDIYKFESPFSHSLLHSILNAFYLPYRIGNPNKIVEAFHQELQSLCGENYNVNDVATKIERRIYVFDQTSTMNLLSDPTSYNDFDRTSYNDFNQSTTLSDRTSYDDFDRASYNDFNQSTTLSDRTSYNDCKLTGYNLNDGIGCICLFRSKLDIYHLIGKYNNSMIQTIFNPGDDLIEWIHKNIILCS